MQIPQVALALLCIGFGLVPVLPLMGVHRAISCAVSPEMLHANPLTFQALAGNSPAGLQLMFGAAPGAIWLPLVSLVALALCMGFRWGWCELAALLGVGWSSGNAELKSLLQRHGMKPVLFTGHLRRRLLESIR